MNSLEKILSSELCGNFLLQCFAEDCAGNDVTGNLLRQKNLHTELYIVAREEGVLSGATIIKKGLSFTKWNNIHFTQFIKDGDSFARGQSIGVLKGSHCQLVSIERTVLNILGHFSGIATCARKYVLASNNIPIFDTRKTTPTLRRFEKYACFCGGAQMHRENLETAIMIKDNHLIEGVSYFEQVNKMLSNIKNEKQLEFIEIEVDTVNQLEDFLINKKYEVDIILLDNFSINDLNQAVLLRDKYAPKIILEASGGITLKNIEAVAGTNIDRIATGAMIRESSWIDIGVDWK